MRIAGSRGAKSWSNVAFCSPATCFAPTSSELGQGWEQPVQTKGKGSSKMKMARYLTMLPLIAGAAIGVLASGAAAAKDFYVIGVSNTVQGNGWREEMICAIKAQALASGKVSKLNIAHRNTDAAGQLEDIRNLISAGVDAIVVNPADPSGINAALAEATKKGIVVVAVDQAVTEPSAYVISNNQEEYAYLGAKWLFDQLGGKG